MKIYDFKKQLDIGSRGEDLFLEYHPDIKKLDGRKGDFIGASGRKIELKTDSRTVKQTPNIFIERFRDAYKNNGGPYQAQEHGVYYFVYMFACGTIYWFKVDALVEHLEDNKDEYQVRQIQNKGWSAVGYLVPRSSLEVVIEKKENIFERGY